MPMQGIKLISMRTDNYSPIMEFQPGGSFVKPLKLDLKFVGMKLERYNLSDGKTDFLYIADDGTTVVIKNDGLNVNLAEKKAEVRGAELKHFSRYGFVRKFSQESSSSSSLLKERNNEKVFIDNRFTKLVCNRMFRTIEYKFANRIILILRTKLDCITYKKECM